MKEERTDHPTDPRSTETFSHKWAQNCPLDRKQGLGGWTKRDGLCCRRGEQDIDKLLGGC